MIPLYTTSSRAIAVLAWALLAMAPVRVLAAGTASIAPANFTRGQSITINFNAVGGPLAGVTTPPLRIHYGFNNWSSANPTDPQMTAGAANQWSYTFTMPANATQIDFVFRNEAGNIYDNNNTADWHIVMDVSEYDLGSTLVPAAQGGGTVFRVWAPNATNAQVRGQFNGYDLSNTMTKNAATGIWSTFIYNAVNGQQYKYYLNNASWRKDPRARRVNNSNGDSIIYNAEAFNWESDAPVIPALRDLVIYEMHIGSWDVGAAVPGTFTEAISRLGYLQSLGINAIEVMPVNETPGTGSIGYNPSDPYAVETDYGSADGFKSFVKACHQRGIAVLLDVVHNHWGPGDLDLYGFDNGGTSAGIYFYDSPPALAESGFGPRPEFSAPQVSLYIQDNITMWMDEYRVDGFRWDFTKAIRGTVDGNFNVTGDIAEGIALLRTANNLTHGRGKITTAEDLGGVANLTQPTSNPNGYGFDSQWIADYHYTVVDELAATDNNRNVANIASQIDGDFRTINYLESHDETWAGNNRLRIPRMIENATPTSPRSRKLGGIGAVTLFCSQGVPLLFQGQEWGEEISWDTNVGMNWSKHTTAAYGGTHSLYTDLIALRRNLRGGTRGLSGDTTNIYLTLEGQKVLAWYRQSTGGQPGDTVVVLANFSNASYSSGFEIGFPAAGIWNEQLNSDSSEYGADFTNVGVGQTVTTTANPMHGFAQRGKVFIGPYSAVIMSQAPPGGTPQNMWELF